MLFGWAPTPETTGGRNERSGGDWRPRPFVDRGRGRRYEQFKLRRGWPFPDRRRGQGCERLGCSPERTVDNGLRPRDVRATQAQYLGYRRDSWVVVESPYRSLIRPFVSYLDVTSRDPEAITVVIIPEYVARHWWGGCSTT